jgi:hypothetical protein
VTSNRNARATRANLERRQTRVVCSQTLPTTRHGGKFSRVGVENRPRVRNGRNGIPDISPCFPGTPLVSEFKEPVRSGEVTMITVKQILVATDFSEPSDAALAYGRELAGRFGGQRRRAGGVIAHASTGGSDDDCEAA